MFFHSNFEREWLERMQELQRQQNEDSIAPVFPFAPQPFNFVGVPRFYFLMPSTPVGNLTPEHEDQILENIKKIIEFMYATSGLPEEAKEADETPQKILSPEEAGLDMKRLLFVKYLVEHGVFSESL